MDCSLISGGGAYPPFNSVDAPLWFFWTVQQYMEQGGTMAGNGMAKQQSLF